MLKSVSLVLALLASPGIAMAQSAPSNPAMTYGMVPTVGQWNNWFQQKQDRLGYVPVNRNGDTMQGKLIMAASTSSTAGFNLPPGTAPDAPVDGDLWMTNDGLFAQVGGVTIGPIRNGNVAGPATTVVGDLPTFSTTDGSALADSGQALPLSPLVGTTDNQTLTNKTLTAPVLVSPSMSATVTVGGVPTTFPGSGNLVGTTDSQTLTNKSIDASEINSGTLANARLPAPTAVTLGGVISSVAPASQFATGINTSGAETYAQPTIGNLGNIAANTVVGNATGSSAAPAALTTLPSGLTLPSPTLSGTTTWSGFGNGQIVTNGSGVAFSSPIFDGIAAGMNANGTFDNTTVFQTLLTTVGASGGQVRLACGHYKISSALATTIAAGKSLTIVGGGQDCTYLDFPSAAGSTWTFGATTSSLHIRDLTATTSITATGTAFTLTQNAPSANPANAAESDFTNVTLRGSDGYAAAEYWATGIKVNGVSNINFYGLFVPGTGALAGNGVDLAGLPSSTACAGGPCFGVVYNFVDCTFNFGNVGIIYDSFVQGVAVANSNFTGGHFGIASNASETGTLDQLSIVNSQFAASNAGLDFNTVVSGVMVTSSVFITPASGAQAIFGTMNEFSIVGNQFVAATTSSTIAVQISSVSNNGIVTGNTFTTYGTAVTVGAATANVSVQSNIYNANTTNTSPSASTGNVKIGGGSA